MWLNICIATLLQICQSITFTVDASQAGEGTLELVVTTTKSSVKADVRARSRGLYDVTFIPQEAVPHFVNITFNDEDVPGKQRIESFYFTLAEIHFYFLFSREPFQVWDLRWWGNRWNGYPSTTGNEAGNCQRRWFERGCSWSTGIFWNRHERNGWSGRRQNRW